MGPLKVSGGGSAQFTVKGGDNSIQEYGHEAGEPDLSEAAEAVHAFYVARVRGDWGRACSLLSRTQVASLEELAASSSRPSGMECPDALAAFTKQVPPSTARLLTTVDAAALRRDGKQAFLVYIAPPGQTVYSMPLASEDGSWKLDAISGAVLSGA